MRRPYLIEATICLALLVQVGALSVQSGRNSRNSRNNLFDPIYAYDDIDAHTVLAGSPSKQRAVSQQSVLDDDNYILSKSTSSVAHHTSSPAGSSSTRPASEPTLAAAITPTFSPSSTRTVRSRTSAEPARHWSALENYYRRLNQPAYQPMHGDEYYQVPNDVIQQEPEDSLVSGRRPTNSYPPYPHAPGTIVLSRVQTAPHLPPFLLPLLSPVKQPSAVDSSWNERDNGVYQTAPGLSRLGQGTLGEKKSLLPAEIAEQNRSFTLPFITVDHVVKPDDKRVELRWRKLPELLMISQQQQRAKHQQDTFGSFSWYDHQRSRELLKEEAYCGPRNYINIPPVHLSGRLQSAQATKTSQQLDEKYQQLDASGEYPSHMGIYNGSKPDEHSFLCAATWVHDSFAVTIASCVRWMDPKQLSVRVGEWNLNRNSTDERPMITREVQNVYIFPKYRNDSLDHNLALIEFTSPIDYLQMPYACPACQIQSRTSMRVGSCWAPVRNITLSEYFDAEGEGETRERRTVNMAELEVRLIANDDTECFRQTKMEFFNFQHPNYICSADLRNSTWRARLNQTNSFGSGIYCNEAGILSLVSILHPVPANSSSAFGFLDLTYYKPWMRSIISGRNY